MAQQGKSNGSRPNSPQHPNPSAKPHDDPSMMGQVREGVEHTVNRLGESLGSARDMAQHGLEQGQNLVSSNPLPAILAGFGLGFGIGLAITALLVHEEEEPWYERSYHRLADPVRDFDYKQAYHRLSGTIHDLPETIARKIPSSLKG